MGQGLHHHVDDDICWLHDRRVLSRIGLDPGPNGGFGLGCLASGALTNLDMPVDDIQAQLDKVSGSAQVENDLAALKAELSTSGPAGELPGPAEDKVVDVEASPAAPAEPQPAAAEPAPAPGEQGGGA